MASRVNNSFSFNSTSYSIKTYKSLLTRSLREPGIPCTKSIEVSESRMERVKHKFLGVFSHESRFEIAMTNCKSDIWVTECIHERELRLLWVCNLAVQSGEKKCGSFLCSSDMLIAISFEIKIYISKCAVYRRKWLEGHVASPPNHNL